MRWVTPSRLVKFVLVLVFLTGMEFSVAPMPAIAGTHVMEDTRNSIGGDFQPCGKQGMMAGICQAACALVSAINPDLAADSILRPSRFWLSQDMTVFGRVVRPSLAPPRIL